MKLTFLPFLRTPIDKCTGVTLRAATWSPSLVIQKPTAAARLLGEDSNSFGFLRHSQGSRAAAVRRFAASLEDGAESIRSGSRRFRRPPRLAALRRPRRPRGLRGASAGDPRHRLPPDLREVARPG